MSKKLWRVGKEELNYVRQVIDKGFTGEFTEKFEKEFAKKFKIKYAISVNSGTSALHTALLALSVGRGDEVIVPPLTFAATGFAPLYTGAISVFADIDPYTFNIDPAEIEKKITKKTKAIIVVSLYGLPPEMDKIITIARKYNLKVIEDNAQCVFGKYKNKIAGTIGDIATFSIQRSKHLTTGDGGIITTNNRFLAEKIRKISDLGYRALKAEPGVHMICKETLQQPEFKRHELVGYNFRLPEVCAAMGLAQLEKLDELIDKRIAIANLYKDAAKGCNWLKPQMIPKGVKSSYWAYVMKIDNSKTRVSWKNFRKVFLKLGGQLFYGAWSLTYLEPALEGKKFTGNSIKYKQGLCPVAELVQPHLIQLKTNFQSLAYGKKQADILRKTIKRLDK